MGDATELVKLQRSKWAVLSTVVQAQVVVIGAALIAAVEGATTAGWINAGVAIVGAVLSIVGRFAAEGGLTWTKPQPSDHVAVEVPTDAARVTSTTPPKG